MEYSDIDLMKFGIRKWKSVFFYLVFYLKGWFLPTVHSVHSSIFKSTTVESETLLCKMDVSGLIKSINTATASVNFNKVDSNERRELLQACEQLRNICETPLDTIIRLYYSVDYSLIPLWESYTDLEQGPQMIILRLAVDLKLFDSMAKLSDQKANKDVLIEQLSFETGAEPLLIGRQFKILAFGHGCWDD